MAANISGSEDAVWGKQNNCKKPEDRLKSDCFG